MTGDERLQRAAAFAEQRRWKADELRSRADAVCDAADHRMQSSSDLQAASRRLLREQSTPIRDTATD